MLLTVEDIAKILQVSTNTVYYWVGRNEIPFMKIGKHLRFDREEVVNYFKKKTAISAQSYDIRDKYGYPKTSQR